MYGCSFADNNGGYSVVQIVSTVVSFSHRRFKITASCVANDIELDDEPANQDLYRDLPTSKDAVNVDLNLVV